MKFYEYNENPKKLKTGDCVVIAIAYATNQTWDKVYMDLTTLGFEMKMMPNSRKVWTTYIESLGWVKQRMPKKDNNKRYTLNEFAKQSTNKMIIAKIATHLTVIDKGTIVDTHNCGEWCIGNYWIKE